MLQFSHRHRNLRAAVNFFLPRLCIKAFNFQYFLYLPALSDLIMTYFYTVYRSSSKLSNFISNELMIKTYAVAHGLSCNQARVFCNSIGRFDLVF